MERVGTVAYHIKLPDSCRLHPIFHISKLKKALSPKATPLTLPPALAEDGELLVQPASVLGTRNAPEGSLEVLIHWEHLPSFDDNWESVEKIATIFPNFYLEDKVTFEGGMVLAKGDLVWIFTQKKGSNSKIRRFRFKILF